jgi:hypothetical protein
MHIGVCMFATMRSHRGWPRGGVARVQSLFVPEHTHIPVSRRTPSLAAAAPTGIPTPSIRSYSHTAAAATKRIRIGTGICLIIERDTIITAGGGDSTLGRALGFGIGAGGVPKRWRTGTDYTTLQASREQVRR